MSANLAIAKDVRLYYGHPDEKFQSYQSTHHWVGGIVNNSYVDGFEASSYCLHCPAEKQIRVMRDGTAEHGNDAAARPCPGPELGPTGRGLRADGYPDRKPACYCGRWRPSEYIDVDKVVLLAAGDAAGRAASNLKERIGGGDIATDRMAAAVVAVAALEAAVVAVAALDA